MTTYQPITRRALLGGAVAAVAGSTGCGGTGPAESQQHGTVEPPVRIPYTGVKADLPAGDHAIPAGYFHYPKNPPVFSRADPVEAGDVTVLTQSDIVMAELGKNRWWQEVNAATRANLKVTSTTSVDYTAKFQVTVAGGDLPDLLLFTTVANTPALLRAQFADLSEHLGGEAIRDYPGLASLPSSVWDVSTIDGRIWGIPKPVSPAGTVISTRGDLLTGMGLEGRSPELSSGDDFLALCQQLTDPARRKWALGSDPTTWILNAVLEMMGAPNGWQEEGGRFTNVAETDAMKEALSVVQKMWTAGYIHPDSFGTPGKNYTWWSEGTTSLYIQSFSGWARYARANPGWDIGVVRHPAWGGGGFAPKYLSAGGYGAFAAFKKAPPDRLRRLLQIVDYLAAPFGTREYLLTNYGVAGVDYELSGSDPIATAAGGTDYPQGILYCGAQGNVDLYVPGADDILTEAHRYLSDVLPTAVANAAARLYSETAVTDGATANKNLTAAKGDIIQGRRQVSDWDEAVKAWRREAGDQMRAEYEQAHAAR